MQAIQVTQNLKKKANELTNRNTIFAAGAGLIPFPIVDVAALFGVQLTMVKSIANLYNVDFKQHRAKSLIGALLSNIGSFSLLKFIPGLGLIGGAGSVVGASAATYALGRVFTQHFDQGGTLLDFDPIASKKYFQEEFEAGKLFISLQNIGKSKDQSDTFTTLGLASSKQKILAQKDQMNALLKQIEIDLNFIKEKRSKKNTLVATDNDIIAREIARENKATEVFDAGIVLDQAIIEENNAAEEVKLKNDIDSVPKKKAIIVKENKAVDVLDAEPYPDQEKVKANSIAEVTNVVADIDSKHKEEITIAIESSHTNVTEKEVEADFNQKEKVKRKVTPKRKNYRKTIFDKEVDLSNLTIVEGIGPKTATVLNKAGINNLNQLAKSKAPALKQILIAAKGNFKMMNPTSWPQQADLAASGKLVELKALQEVLIGGRANPK